MIKFLEKFIIYLFIYLATPVKEIYIYIDTKD